MEESKVKKLTMKTRKAILTAIAIGGTIEEACSAARISKDTFYRWCKEFPDFTDECERAKHSQVLTWLGVIERKVQEGDWHAASWKLEHIYPERFSRSRLEVSGLNGGPVEVNLPPDAESAALARALLRRMGATSSVGDASGAGTSRK